MPRNEREAIDNDADEQLLDQLRGGEFGDLVKTATAAQEAQQSQFCVQANGAVAKADPYTQFAAAHGATVLPTPAVEKQSEEDDYEKELKEIRAARMAQMANETTWKAQGHGKLRELQDEKEFVATIAPHERAVVCLEDGDSPGADEVVEALAKLAPRHLEVQFCRLPVERALFMTRMVQLEGLPCLFIVSYGEVQKMLSPTTLFERSSASSPLFPKHLARLLYRVGAMTTPEAASGSEDEDEMLDRGKDFRWTRR